MNNQSVVTGHCDYDHPGLCECESTEPIVLRGKPTMFTRNSIFMRISKVACLLQDWIEEVPTIRGKVHQAPQDMRPSISPKLLPVRSQRQNGASLSWIRDKLPGVGGCVVPGCSWLVPGTWAESRLWLLRCHFVLTWSSSAKAAGTLTQVYHRRR